MAALDAEMPVQLTARTISAIAAAIASTPSSHSRQPKAEASERSGLGGSHLTARRGEGARDGEGVRWGATARWGEDSGDGEGARWGERARVIETARRGEDARDGEGATGP